MISKTKMLLFFLQMIYFSFLINLVNKVSLGRKYLVKTNLMLILGVTDVTCRFLLTDGQQLLKPPTV